MNELRTQQTVELKFNLRIFSLHIRVIAFQFPD